MSFLDKIRAKNAENNTAAASTTVAKEVPAATVTAEKTVQPAAAEKKASPLRSLLAKKKAATESTEKKEPIAEEVTKKDAASVESETTKAEEVEAPAPEVEAEGEKEEAPKKKPRGRKASAKKKKADEAAAEEEATSEEEAEESTTDFLNAREFDVVNVLGTKMTYEEAAAKVMSAFEDDEWLKFKNEIEQDLHNIKIAADMNPGTLKYTLMEINDLYGKIAIAHANMSALLKALTNEESGVCTAIRLQASRGENKKTNEQTRRANGYDALCNATYQGDKINFINLIAATRIKFVFLDSIKQRIQFMSNLCITMNGALKLEEKLDPGINAA